MRSLEYAQLLLRKAAQDEFVINALGPNPGAPDEVVGFHAQQAVEKMLKAALSAQRIRYRRTHDLVELIDLLRESGTAFPEELDDVRRLGPFAIELRYDELPEATGEALDRAWAMDCVRRTRQWAEGIIGEAPQDE